MKQENLKQETERILKELKMKGYERDLIEKELGYSENYVDQQLSKGSNRRFLNAIIGLNSRVLQKATSYKDEQHEDDRKQSLEKSIENLTQNELRTSAIIEALTQNESRNTAIIERLVTLLEKNYSGPTLAPVGTEGTETMRRKKAGK